MFQELLARLTVSPTVLPVSIREIDMTLGCFDMRIPLADPCPQCGAFNMQVGDYVCWGHCGACYDTDLKASKQACNP